ncbi:unnamed protein product [Urochloa humidicola]
MSPQESQTRDSFRESIFDEPHHVTAELEVISIICAWSEDIRSCVVPVCLNFQGEVEMLCKPPVGDDTELGPW